MGLIRARNQVVTTVVALPDQFALEAQSLGAVVNTSSPASRGTGNRAYTGLAGSDVNQCTTNFAPILPHVQAVPMNPNLEPGSLPTADGPGAGALDWMTFGQLGGMGG